MAVNGTGRILTTLSGLSKYHYFICAVKCLHCELFANCDAEEFHLEINENIIDTPEEIVPPGLFLERQWYLHQQIHGLCSNELRKENVAPKRKNELPKTKVETETAIVKKTS